MKKLSLITALALIAFVATAATIVGLTVCSLPQKGEWVPTGIEVASPIHVQAYNCLPTNGTLIIKQRINAATTNTIYTGTATNGIINHAISGTAYIIAGDTLIREGTITNAAVRLILEGS